MQGELSNRWGVEPVLSLSLRGILATPRFCFETPRPLLRLSGSGAKRMWWPWWTCGLSVASPYVVAVVDVWVERGFSSPLLHAPLLPPLLPPRDEGVRVHHLTELLLYETDRVWLDQDVRVVEVREDELGGGRLDTRLLVHVQDELLDRHLALDQQAVRCIGHPRDQERPFFSLQYVLKEGMYVITK